LEIVMNHWRSLMRAMRHPARRNGWLWAALGALVVVVGCEPTIDPTHYDQTCSQDDDCVAVVAGGVCSLGCSDGEGVINKGALPQFNDDLSSIQRACLVADTVDCIRSIQLRHPACSQGRCALVLPQ
jgi:hypothetical protein